jgi:predicted NAD-dependent protein-ADP-ribosyltransferase YbiA (DUF1768 family)
MTKAIKIFNPKDKPFGWLSNNYKHEMRIDRKSWKTVTNYIYASILQSPADKNIIRLTDNTKEVQELFIKFYQEEINNVIIRSIADALTVKFENEQLSTLLLSTGNSPIFYISNNPLLGTGAQNNGENLYGKQLMQIRHLLNTAYKTKEKETAKAERDQLIYDTYLAEIGLMKAIKSGNDLTQYINKSSAEIVNELGRDTLTQKAPKREYILDNVHRGYFPNIIRAVDYPGTLVLEIRKEKMEDLRVIKLKERKSILFEMYADYLLSKYYTELPADKYAHAKEQQFKDMGWQQKKDLEDRLYDLFQTGMLSSRLSDAFDERMRSFVIPSEQDVNDAKNVVINYTSKPTNTAAPYIPSNGEPILVYSTDSVDEKYRKYVSFSPISLSGMLKINGRIYPTVTNYIIFSLLAHLPGVSVNDAYSYILENPDDKITGVDSFLHPHSAQLKYENIRDINYREQLEKYASEGMNVKFTDRVLQDILIMTGDSELLWGDFSDPILGMGTKENKGVNFVGKYLMKLRRKFNEERKNEQLETINTNDITNVLNTDPFMKEWLRMRVRDMCKVLRTMKNYIWAKDGIDTKFNVDFTTTVLDKIYQPCSQIFGSANKITAEVPQYFRIMVQDCPGFKNIGYDTVEVMWRRLAVMIYYLIEHLEDSTIKNIRAVIGRIELMVSNKAPCETILTDEEDNCIASALINLLKGINLFNKQFSYSTDITAKDVNTAASIILDADVSDEIAPKSKVAKDDGESEIDPVLLELLKGTNIQPDEDDSPTMVKRPIGYDPEIDPEDYGPEFVPESYEDEESERDEDEEFIFPSSPENSDFEAEQEAGFSSDHNMLVGVLSEIEDNKNPELISKHIEGAIETIKKYPMSKHIKRNRINFFATHR